MHVIFHTDDSRAIFWTQLAPELSYTPQFSGPHQNYHAVDEKVKPNLPTSATPSITMQGTEAAARGVGTRGPHTGAQGLTTCRGRREQADSMLGRGSNENEHGVAGWLS